MKIETNRYKMSDPKVWLIFTRPWQYRIHPVLAGRQAYLASVKKKKLTHSYGFRSEGEQEEAAKNSLAVHPDYYQVSSGAVYKPVKGKKPLCMVAAPGLSSHNYGAATDSPDTWIEAMSNEELAPYGLYKPMDYEPWHIELIEYKGASLEEKKAAFYEYMGGGFYPMDVRTIQMITGLKPDNIRGPKTKTKAKEMLPVIHEILDTDYKTAEETIKATQNGTDLWLPRLKEIPYFSIFIMNIVNKMKGLR